MFSSGVAAKWWHMGHFSFHLATVAIPRVLPGLSRASAPLQPASRSKDSSAPCHRNASAPEGPRTQPTAWPCNRDRRQQHPSSLFAAHGPGAWVSLPASWDADVSGAGVGGTETDMYKAVSGKYPDTQRVTPACVPNLRVLRVLARGTLWNGRPARGQECLSHEVEPSCDSPSQQPPPEAEYVQRKLTSPAPISERQPHLKIPDSNEILVSEKESHFCLCPRALPVAGRRIIVQLEMIWLVSGRRSFARVAISFPPSLCLLFRTSLRLFRSRARA
jgi:hypothetical protein